MSSGFGVLEYLSTGVLECWEKPEPQDSILKFLHYSITPADSRAQERLFEPIMVVAQSQVLYSLLYYLKNPHKTVSHTSTGLQFHFKLAQGKAEN